MTGERWQTGLNAPEIQIAIFALLLNLPWEFWQSPFFAGLAYAQHWNAVVMCTKAAFGDVFIALLAFWSVCALARTRRWVTRPTLWQKIVFIAVGLLVTVAIELLSTRFFSHWSYAEGNARAARHWDRAVAGTAVASAATAHTLVRATATKVVEQISHRELPCRIPDCWSALRIKPLQK